MIRDIYFNYGGFYAVFELIGAIKELRKTNQLIHKRCKIYGCSAGAGMAFVYMLVADDFLNAEIMYDEMNRIIDRTKHNSIEKIYMELLDELFSKYCPNDIRFLQKRLNIGISTNNGFVFMNKFESKAHLYHALLLSAKIFGASKCPPHKDNVVCLDGAFQFEAKKHLPVNCLILKPLDMGIVNLLKPPSAIRQILMMRGTIIAKEALDYYKKNGYCLVVEIKTPLQDMAPFAFFVQERFLQDDEAIIQHIQRVCDTSSGNNVA
jgi:hypothetical protein